MSEPTQVKHNARGMPGKDWEEKFLEALRILPNVRAAAAVANVDRATAYRHRAQDEEFAAMWADAIEDACDRLEQEAWRRAVNGVQRPVFGNRGTDENGKKLGTGIVGEVTEYSDNLIIQLLKAHRPEKYRERFEIKTSGDDVDRDLMNAVAELNRLAVEHGNPPVPEE